MRIVALVKPNSGVDYHRITLPLDYWEFDDGDSILRLSANQNLDPKALEGADILFYSMACPYNIETILKLKRQYGFKIVLDIDDYWYLHSHHHRSNYWISNRISHKVIASMKTADMVITTHSRLQERISTSNKNVHVVANALPLGFGQFVYRNPVVNPPILLYASGTSHLHDLEIIRASLRACSKDAQLRDCTFVLAGYGDTPTWNKMLNVCKNFGNYGVRPVLSLEKYMDHYDHANVSIAPLENNEFNTYKSNLKIIEAGAKKLPIIASAVHPYNLDDVPGVTLCRTSQDWYKAIKRLLENPQKAKSEGQMLYEYVNRMYNLVDHNKKRKQLFKWIQSRESTNSGILYL
jgi:glycosyltransferase involved in cell wall biosynthesis